MSRGRYLLNKVMNEPSKIEIIIDARYHPQRLLVASNLLKDTENFTIDSIQGFLRRYITNRTMYDQVIVYLAGKQSLLIEIDKGRGLASFEKISMTKPKIVQSKESLAGFEFEEVRGRAETYKIAVERLINSSGL